MTINFSGGVDRERIHAAHRDSGLDDGELAEMDADFFRGDTSHRALIAGWQEATERVHERQREKGRILESARQNRITPDPKVIQRLDEAEAREVEGRDRAMAALEGGALDISATKDYRAAAYAYLGEHLTSGILSRHEPPDAGSEPAKVLAEAREELAVLAEDKAATRKLPPPPSEVKEKALAQFDAETSDGAFPVVRPDGSLTWPQRHFLSTGSPDAVAYAFDPRAFFFADPGERAKARAHIEASVDALYDGVIETATKAHKREMVASLNEKILDAERREVAAIRALRVLGQHVFFRADTDPRALLNLDGPPPSRQR